MKKIIYGVILLMFIFSVFASGNTGVINSQKIMMKTKIGIKAYQKLEKFKKKKLELLNSKKNIILNLGKEINSPALNNEARKKKTRQMQDLKIELERIANDNQKEMQSLTQKEFTNLQKIILPIVQETAKSKGFKIIHDIASSGIVYVDQSIDISDDVIKSIDLKFPK